jgi:hypothetical protein
METDKITKLAKLAHKLSKAQELKSTVTSILHDLEPGDLLGIIKSIDEENKRNNRPPLLRQDVSLSSFTEINSPYRRALDQYVEKLFDAEYKSLKDDFARILFY